MRRTVPQTFETLATPQEIREGLALLREEVPEVIHVGGALGVASAVELATGRWLNTGSLVTEDIPTVDYYRQSTCLPVLFFQQVLHQRRLAADRDNLVAHRSVRATSDMKLNCSVELAPDATCRTQPLTHYALSQWCKMLEIPSPFIRRLAFNTQGVDSVPANERLLERMPKLAAANVNVGMEIREATVRGAANGELFIRMNTEGTVRAVLTDSYAVFDNHALVDSIVESFPSEMVPDLLCRNFWCDGDDLLMDVIIPEGWHQEPTGIWGMMVHFGNSEVGHRAVEAKIALYDATTGVTLLYDQADSRNGIFAPIRHVGSVTYETVSGLIRDNLPLLLASSRGLQQLFQSTRSILIQNVKETLAYLADQHDLRPEQGRAWYAVWDSLQYNDGARGTVFGLLRALLVHAGTCNGIAQETLQLVAGRILAQRLNITQEQLLSRWQHYMAEGQRLQRRDPDKVLEYTVGTEVPNG